MEDRLHTEPRDAPGCLRGLEEESREPEDPKKKAKKKAARKRIAEEAKKKQRKLDMQERMQSEPDGPRAEEDSTSPENPESYEKPETAESTETRESESISHRELKQEPLRTAEREPTEPQLYTRQRQKKT